MSDLKVAFSRLDVANLIQSQGIASNVTTLDVTGQFSDGWAFAGNNQVDIVQKIPVGGLWTSVNKFELLAPWIGLASLITIATVSIVYAKHRKKKQT